MSNCFYEKYYVSIARFQKSVITGNRGVNKMPIETLMKGAELLWKILRN